MHKYLDVESDDLFLGVPLSAFGDSVSWMSSLASDGRFDVILPEVARLFVEYEVV